MSLAEAVSNAICGDLARTAPSILAGSPFVSRSSSITKPPPMALATGLKLYPGGIPCCLESSPTTPRVFQKMPLVGTPYCAFSQGPV